MKKYKRLASILGMVLLISACQKEVPRDGVTITKEMYDELTQAQEENSQLVLEVATLKAELDALRNSNQDQAPPSETDEKGEGSQTDDQEEKAPTYTKEELQAMTLSPYTDSYGLVGYKNQDGKIILEAKYDTASVFSGDLASVTYGGKTGTLTKDLTENWVKVDTYKRGVLEPVNDVVAGSPFDAFLTAYLDALDKQDEAFIKAHTATHVKISFGGHSGWEGLVDYWKLDEGSDDFYAVMKNTLKYGAVKDAAGEGYTAPYVFTDFPESYDAFTFVAAVGKNINVRNLPTTEASTVIAQLNYDIVKFLDSPIEGWTKIQLPNGERGFVADYLLRSPIGYRAHFTPSGDTWLLDFFVAGD